MENEWEGETPRKVTEREIFDDEFLTQWKTCFEIAKTYLESKCDINKIEVSDLLSATAQLNITWNTNRNYIENLKIKRQAEIDKKFGKQ